MNLACTPAHDGQMCAYLSVCDDQSYCDQGDSFTCKPRHGAGSTCGSDDQCDKSTYCDTSGADGPVCKARLPAGSPCKGGGCAAGLYCVTSGTTSTCSAGPAGTPCDKYDGPFCPTGFNCNDRDDTCHALGTEGTACRDNAECEAGLYCRNYTTCKANGTAGEMCSSSSEPCADAFYCDSSARMCKADAQLGEPCGGSMPPCEPGLQCASSLCAPGKTIGQSCSNDNECASRVCDSSAGCLSMRECRLP